MERASIRTGLVGHTGRSLRGSSAKRSTWRVVREAGPSHGVSQETYQGDAVGGARPSRLPILVGSGHAPHAFFYFVKLDANLLEVRVFDRQVKRAAYAKQTQEAEVKGESNCPFYIPDIRLSFSSSIR